jgi:hypothetical protein
MDLLDLVPAPDALARKMAARFAKRRTIMRNLLREYARFAWVGLTAEEAATKAGYDASSGAWKRVSDLLHAGLVDVRLDDEGAAVTRPGRSGRQQRVLVITDLGEALVSTLRAQEGRP